MPTLNWKTNIDHLAKLAQVEIIKHGLRARCEIKGLTEHHIRSLEQLRRDRVAERLNKQGDRHG